MSRVPLLVVLAFALVAAGAAAQDDRNQLAFSSPTSAELVIEGIITGENAAGVRQNIEHEAGDGDDVVNQTELDAFEAAFVAFADENRDQLRDETQIHLDGNKPSDANLTAYELDGATGPVDSQEPVNLYTAIDFSWSVAAGDRHRLLLGTVAAAGSDDVATTFIAPPGYLIESHENMPPGARLSPDARTLNVTGSSEDATIVFVREGAGGAGGILPGPSLGVVLAAAVVAAVVARRR